MTKNFYAKSNQCQCSIDYRPYSEAYTSCQFKIQMKLVSQYGVNSFPGSLKMIV